MSRLWQVVAVLVVGLVTLLVAPETACAAAEETRHFSAVVVGVVDGDTLTVQDEDGVQRRVRLYGIDVPERDQAFGHSALLYNRLVALGTTVTVQVKASAPDRYGRVIGQIVLKNGGILSEELVREGLAWYYERYAPGEQDLRALQAEAFAAKRGLWSQPAPEAPWRWRARMQVAEASYQTPIPLPVAQKTAVPRTRLCGVLRMVGYRVLEARVVRIPFLPAPLKTATMLAPDGVEVAAP